MENRQLRYFATLAEELHFGRAAKREHIVQSALSQQIQRLERELGVSLLERNTHHVRLTTSGEVFLIEAKQILNHLELAAAAARTAMETTSLLRVAVGDASLDSMPHVLRLVHQTYPHLQIRQIEAGVPQQYRMLADGRLDVGIGRASLASPDIASELLRLDGVGVLVSDTHPLAGLNSASVEILGRELLVLPDENWAPEFNQFVTEMCRSAGFTPVVHRWTVQSIAAAAHVVEDGQCVMCVPRSCRFTWPGTCWLPILDAPPYPWSLLWRAEKPPQQVSVALECGRQVARTLGWIDGLVQPVI